MAANNPSTKSEMIKSHHREADVKKRESAPIPAKETQTGTKISTKTDKKTAASTTKSNAPMTTSSTTGRKAAPAINENSSNWTTKRPGKGAAHTVTSLTVCPYPDSRALAQTALPAVDLVIVLYCSLVLTSPFITNLAILPWSACNDKQMLLHNIRGVCTSAAG